MRILAVDTSSEHGSVCVLENDDVVAEVRLSSSIQHSERLFASIEFIFRFLPFKLENIDLFVAARGPGSFTGLRVGLAATEGFVAAFGRQGAGVSTLEGLAWNVGETPMLIAPTIDARRGEVYGALYRREGQELIEALAPAVLKPAEWFSRLPRVPVVLCGDGAARYCESDAVNPAWELRKVDFYLARAIAEIALTPTRGPLQPLYIRKTDAELGQGRGGTGRK
jgi:tRNA threonylcarbamoyladenosine biosynthesis protein TsaB